MKTKTIYDHYKVVRENGEVKIINSKTGDYIILFEEPLQIRNLTK